MQLREEIAEAQRRFGLLSFYDKFEHVVILILAGLIAVFGLGSAAAVRRSSSSLRATQ
jgi:hypothetical protein